MAQPASPEVQAPSKAGTSALDPAFRLPVGGMPLAGPIIDSLASPPLAWLLSEDLGLYALSETGKLAAHIDLSESGVKPARFLAVDPFGRVLVAQGGRLTAYTRLGSRAWSGEFGPGSSVPQCAFGSDGRAFALLGRSLSCFSPGGRRLWQLDLAADPCLPICIDGLGRLCLALSDGRFLITTAYGEVAVSLEPSSVPQSACAIPVGTELDPKPTSSVPTLALGLADGRLLFLGPRGELLASCTLPSPAISLAADGAVLAGLCHSGEAFACDYSGAKLWSTPTSCKSGRILLFAERIVVAGQGRAVSLSRSGEVFREMSIPGASGALALSPAGLAFSALDNWVLAAYRFEPSLGKPAQPQLRAYAVQADFAERELRINPLAADADNQIARLGDIEKRLGSGSIGVGESEAAAYCSAVATRAFDRGLSAIDRRRSSNPLARARACAVLGELGSPAYRAALFKVLEEDEDPAVRAAACDALAAIGVDPNGSSMAAFLALPASGDPAEEETALAVVASIEAITLRSGRIPSDDGLRALVKLASPLYGKNVRSRAQAAIARISGTMNY